MSAQFSTRPGKAILRIMQVPKIGCNNQATTPNVLFLLMLFKRAEKPLAFFVSFVYNLFSIRAYFL